jgi:hypothetical protein
METNAVRSVVEHTTHNGKFMHFVGKVRSHANKFSLEDFYRDRESRLFRI